MEINKLVFKPKQQTESNNCVSACIAMVTGADVVDVTSEFNIDYHANKTQAHDYFDEFGIEYRMCHTVERDLKPGHVYMISVPSLNIENSIHCLMAQTFEDGWIVIDPNEGKEGRRHFTHHPDNLVGDDKAVLMSGNWFACYEFESDHVRHLNNLNIEDVS